LFEKLIEILQASFEALIPFVILADYQEGVSLRLGRFHRKLMPGFHWKIPYFDSVLHDDVKPRTERITGLATTTADGKSVGFDAVITYSISDIRKALLEVHDLKDSIADACAGCIGTELSNKDWDSVRNGKVSQDLTTICRKRGWKWGVEIDAVQLVGVALVKNLRISGNGGHAEKALHPTGP
jgi:regulator of protease activity HflC (stomatin/prohibitin superfamily)